MFPYPRAAMRQNCSICSTLQRGKRLSPQRDSSNWNR
ncbi:hypothetical protein FE275_16705 [Pseudomonas koreensis]|uniref:Uncharacterized protein n=2 Tax=Pseudomonas TaxID=286 RepID=A0A5C4KRD8_PSEJE|nr:hypothetical protein FE275_16705 [Pseudomonas koreensis]QBR34406.1 hypothetical protein E3Z29_14530 [Pseudomonas sp. S150]QBX44360.1 hypothetical protein E4T63_11660 [Pseudomonas fluorescens]TNB90715.1 hypothetical protein FHG55_28515 [Pseudomonas jessenii]